MDSPIESPKSLRHKSISYERMETSPTEKPLENKGYLIFLTLIGSFGGVLLGYDLNIIGFAGLYMYDDDSIGKQNESITALVTTMGIIGCTIGTIAGGNMGDQYGRKKTIMIADVFMIIGEVILTTAMHLGMLFAGRLIIGLGIGMLCTTCPNYLSEAAPDSHRGLIAGSNAFFITAAQLLTPVIGLIFQTSWRYMFAVALLFSAGQLIGFCFLPESPKWLFKKGRDQEAEEALARIRLPSHKRNIDSLQDEIRIIKLSIANDNNDPYLTQLKSLFRNCKRQVTLGCCIQILQQLTGINTAMYYGPAIAKQSIAGGSNVLGMLYTIPIYGTNAIFSGVGVNILDKAGRRSLLLWTIPGIVAGLAILSVLFGIQIAVSNDTLSIMIIVGIVIYIAFFALAMGPIPWTLNAEIYPTQYTSIGSSVAATANWVTNTINSQIYGSINSTPVGALLPWVFYAACTTICWFFVYLKVPETKGKSEAEIQELFGSSKNAIRDPLI